MMADRLGGVVAQLEQERADLRVEKERLRVTIESIGDAVIVTDARGRIEFINPRAEELTGYTSAESRGRPIAEVLPLVSETTGRRVPCPLALALSEDRVVEVDSHTRVARNGGARLAISDTAAPIRAGDGAILGGVMVFQDESERRGLMQRLAWQAERDHLTGLWNRRAMEDRLNTALTHVQAGDHSYIFCYIDLDRFKLVNDTCGHRAGDALLQRLTSLLAGRETDAVTPWRGSGATRSGFCLRTCHAPTRSSP